MLQELRECSGAEIYLRTSKSTKAQHNDVKVRLVGNKVHQWSCFGNDAWTRREAEAQGERKSYHARAIYLAAVK